MNYLRSLFTVTMPMTGRGRQLALCAASVRERFLIKQKNGANQPTS
jgi:hypothetical protein